MADEKIVTNIVANSDFSNLIADVQRVTSSLSRLQQEVAGSNRALSGQISATNAMFKESMLKTGQFSSHFVSLTSDVEKFGKNLDSGRLKLRDYFKVYQDHTRTTGGLIRDLAKQQVQLQNAVLQPLGKNAQGLMQYNVHIPRGLDLTKNKASILKQELQVMNKVIQDGGVQLINWGKNTQWAGRQLTVGLTLPLAAFGKAAADAFKQADQELTRLTKVYGDIAGTSSQDLAKIRKDVAATAKELSSTMGVNFKETIGLAADIAATGKTGNELLSSVSETTRLAVLGEVDRQEAMKATLAIQSAFKQNTKELSESINFLNAVENQTSTTLNDLVEAIPKAGPVIKGLGGSVQDLALYLTAMREGGINATEGANALKSALASLINPTDVAVSKFQTFGIDLLGIVSKNAGNTTETLFALQAALDKLNPLQKQQAIEQLFGKFQFSRLNALFENLGRQGSQTLQVLDLMKASAGELEAVASRELSAVTESASGRYRRALEGLRAELAGVGDDFLDIGTKLINALSKILDFAQKLPDPIKKVLAFGGAFTAILGPVIMLTGVLANFFGYVIKGLGHFKALFKGAEGFKLLTPEIMAARAAASQLSDEFYSDAAAADTLRIAIQKLKNDLIDLRTNAASISSAGGVGQVISTVAGTPLATVGGRRIVDPTHPLLGGESRAAAHLNPRDPRNPSTIFGLTLQPIPLNRKLGRTPQILMQERLPDIEGVTAIGGRSTGVVASEHARYAALMGALGVQSRQEIEALKKTIGLGGQVSREFIDTFDDILPITQRLTANAATQSAAIVADLRAGKISAEVALGKIMAANAELERMLGIEVTAYAASRGRTIDLTKAPLIDQPVVDAQGKPNTRGMFRTGIFSKVMQSLGRATRTRTLGGPYSIETTRPPGYNTGGEIYDPSVHGAVVPGPNVNYDIVPANVPVGGFVLNRESSRARPDLVQLAAQRYSGGQQTTAAVLTPGETLVDPETYAAYKSDFDSANRMNLGGRITGTRTNYGVPLLKNLPASKVRKLFSAFTGSKRFYNLKGTAGVYIGDITDPKILARFPQHVKDGKISRQTINGLVTEGKVPGELFAAAIKASKFKYIGSADQFLDGLANSRIISSQRAKLISDKIEKEYFEYLKKSKGVGDANNEYWRIANRIIQEQLKSSSNGTFLWKKFSRSMSAHTGANSVTTGSSGGSTSPISLNIPDENGNVVKFGTLQGSDKVLFAHTKTPEPLTRYARSILNKNRGGVIPGYRAGGKVRKGRHAYGDYIIDPKTGTRIPVIEGIPGFGFQQSQQQPQQRTYGMGSMIASTIGSIGGYALGGRFGTGGAMAGSIIGSMLPSMFGGIGGRDYNEKIAKSIFANKEWAKSAATSASQGNRWSKVLSLLIGGLTKTNIIIATATAVIGGAYLIHKRYIENQERIANSYNLTSEQAKKAGLAYVDLTAKLKDALQAQQNLAERNKLIYESLTLSNTPLKLTIEQYKKLKQEVKQTMPEIVNLINEMNSRDAKDYAVQLKTQLMAYGETAEDATKKIYALFAVSNKNSMAASVIGQKSFYEIKTSIDAAIKSIEIYNKAIEKGVGGKAQANAVNLSLESINAAIQGRMNVKGNNVDYYTAMQETLSKILNNANKQKQLTDQTRASIADQNFELGNVLNKSDTIVSTWAKYKLLLEGVNLDLSKLNSQQAIAINNAVQYAIQQTKASLIAPGGALSDENALLEKKKKQLKDLDRIAAGEKIQTQISRRDRIKAIQEEINQIDKLADAKRKSLQQETEDENIVLEIQKKRLQYRDALATGDLSEAAQIQLDIEQLVNTQQKTFAERAIEEKRLADRAPLEAELNRLNKANQDVADKSAIAAASMSSLSKEITTLETTIGEVTDGLLTILKGRLFDPEGFDKSEVGKAAYAALQNILKKTGNVPEIISTLDDAKSKYEESKKPLDYSRNSVTGGAKIATSTATSTGQNFYQVIFGAIEENLKNNELVIKATKVVVSSDATLDGENRGTNVSKDSLERFLKGDKKYIGPALGIKKQLESKSLSKGAIKSIVNELGLERGERFTYNDVTYEVLIGKSAYLDPRAKPLNRFGGGPISGPGTPTSDSILAKVSDGEFVTKASSVDSVGVNRMHTINIKGAQGVIEAARDILDEGKFGGGLIDLPQFVFGGPVKTFASKIGKGVGRWASAAIKAADNKIQDLMSGLGLNSPFDDDVARLVLEEHIDRALKGINALPAIPQSAKQSKFLSRQYADLYKGELKNAEMYKGSKRTVGDWNKTMQDAAENMRPEFWQKQIEDDIYYLERFTADNPQMDEFVKDPWKFMTSNSPQSGIDDVFKDTTKSSALDAPNLFSGFSAPENISLYDYWLGKAYETKLISDTYRDISRIGKVDINKAIKLGLIKPPSRAMGGLINYDKGGKAKKTNWFQDYVSRLNNTNDQLPEWARDPLGSQALLRLIAGQNRPGDKLSAGLFPLTFMGFGIGRSATTGIKGIGSKVAGLFKRTNPTITSNIPAAKIGNLGNIHADFVRAHPQEKNFINYLLSEGLEPNEVARQLAMRRGGLDWRPRKSLINNFDIWGDTVSPSEIAKAQSRVAQDQAAFEDAMLLFPFAKGEKQFDKLGQIIGAIPNVPASKPKGLFQDTYEAGAYVNPVMDIFKKVGVSGSYDDLVNYIIAREAKKGYGIPTRESILESVSGAHINQSLAKAISEIVSKRGFLDTSIFNTLKSGSDVTDNPAVHKEFMRIIQNPKTGAKFFEKASHPQLPIKTSYMEIFSELYGSRLAKYLGIPAPKNTLGFRGGDILSPVVLSEDFSKLGYETVLDRFRTGSSLGLFGTDESLTNILKAGYTLPEPEILKAQLAEDVGKLAGFISLLKSADTFGNEGNLIMTKVGAKLGALDFGFSFEKDIPDPSIFTNTSAMLMYKDNFKNLLNRASFGRSQYDAAGNPIANSFNDISKKSSISDEEFLKNAYRGIANVAERMGNVSNIKKIINLVLRDMTEARPDLDLKMPLDLAEQMSGLVKIFKQKSIGQLAGGGYIGKLHDWNGQVPGPYGQEVSAVLKAGTEGVYQNDYIKSLQNGIMSGNVNINNSVTVNAAANMDIDALTNQVVAKVEYATTSALKKVGGPEMRNMSVRYA